MNLDLPIYSAMMYRVCESSQAAGTILTFVFISHRKTFESLSECMLCMCIDTNPVSVCYVCVLI